MKRITILALHLGYGGIENCIASFVNNMCDKYDITLVSIYKLYPNPAYKIDNRVKIVYLIDNNIALRVDRYKKLLKQGHIIKLFKSLWNDYISKGHIIKLFKDTFNSMKVVRLKRTKMIEYLKQMKTDIVISTRIELNELVSDYVSNNIYKIAWEHNHGDNKYIENVVKSCKNINNIVLVSNSLYNLYKDEINKQNSKLIPLYIPNIIDELSNSCTKLNTKNIISVGRLSKEKGYLDLIDVFKLINEQDKEVKLTIIGDGDQRKEIEKKIKRDNLKNIFLVGFQNKEYINKCLTNSSLYLMTSLTESFGLVLLEAMSVGVPCIAFTSAEGANEIIENDFNGYLISNRDKEEMALKTITLLKDKNKLKELSSNAKKTPLNYTKDVVYKKWIDLIK